MGYGQAFSRSFRPAELDWRPGDPFDIIVNGLCFKPYSSCRFTHHLIDGVLQLVHAHGIQARDVVKVECRIAPIANQVLIYHRPHTALEGKFSMEYCVARALLDREVRLDHFTDEQVCQKEIQDLIPKITPVQVDLKAEDSFEKGEALPPAEIVIKLKNGELFSRRVTTPKGDPGNPMTTEELTDKFKDCARRVLPLEEIDQTLQLFLELEALPNMWPLMERLAPARAQADETR
jgi:2-methylcitrate dehydratase PrpD